MEYDSINLPVRMSAGQCFAISFEHELARKGDLRINKVKAVLEIADVFEDHYIGLWTYTALESDGEKITAYHEGASDILLGIPVHYRAALDGRVERLIDKDDYLIRVLASDYFDCLDQERKSKVFDLMYDMTDSGLAQHSLKVPSILSLCQDTSLVPGELIRSEYETQSTFGNGTIPTYVTLLSKGPCKETGQVMIEYTNEADPEGLSKIVLDFLIRSSPETEFSKSDMKKIKAVQQTQHCKSWIDVDTGIARKAIFEKIIDLPGNPPRLDRYTIVVDPSA